MLRPVLTLALSAMPDKHDQDQSGASEARPAHAKACCSCIGGDWCGCGACLAGVERSFLWKNSTAKKERCLN